MKRITKWVRKKEESFYLALLFIIIIVLVICGIIVMFQDISQAWALFGMAIGSYLTLITTKYIEKSKKKGEEREYKKITLKKAIFQLELNLEFFSGIIEQIGENDSLSIIDPLTDPMQKTVQKLRENINIDKIIDIYYNDLIDEKKGSVLEFERIILVFKSSRTITKQDVENLIGKTENFILVVKGVEIA